jgi:hypothetical protein
MWRFIKGTRPGDDYFNILCIFLSEIFPSTNSNTVLPQSITPCFIANLAYRQNSRLSLFPPLKIPRYTAKLSYRHPPQVFRHQRRKTNLNSPVSTAHNYLLTTVYWSVIMECQNWSSDTVIDLIIEGRNRWSVVLIRIITCIYFSSDYICTFNPE